MVALVSLALLGLTILLFFCVIFTASSFAAAHVPGIDGLPVPMRRTVRRAVFLSVMTLAGVGELWGVMDAWQDRCAHEQRALEQQHQPVRHTNTRTMEV